MKSNIIPTTGEQTAVAGPSLLARAGRRVLLGTLARLQSGELTLVEGDQVLRFGQRTADCPRAATITVTNPRFYGLVAFSGSVGVGES